MLQRIASCSSLCRRYLHASTQWNDGPIILPQRRCGWPMNAQRPRSIDRSEQPSRMSRHVTPPHSSADDTPTPQLTHTSTHRRSQSETAKQLMAAPATAPAPCGDRRGDAHLLQLRYRAMAVRCSHRRGVVVSLRPVFIRGSCFSGRYSPLCSCDASCHRLFRTHAYV